MQGTLFSSDYIVDANGNERLIEINTDTAFTDDFIDNYLNLTDFINVISSNSITEVVVIYKDFHYNFVNKLEDTLSTQLPSVTFTRQLEDINSIYPGSVTDAANKFILRLAYNENALLDSTYAKNKLNLFELFVDNNNTTEIAEFYHSGSNGILNTITASSNASNIPDYISKPSEVQHSSYNLFKGISGSTDQEKLDNVIDAVEDIERVDRMIQKYHFNNGQVVDNRITSIRLFSIVYDTTINLVHLGIAKSSALFTIPSTFEYDYRGIGRLKLQHYYEYATNFPKMNRKQGGFLPTVKVLKPDNSGVELRAVQLNDTLASYFVSGSPDTDSGSVLVEWSVPGNEIPSGSYRTSSVVYQAMSSSAGDATLGRLITDSGYELPVTPSTVFLVHNSSSNTVTYETMHNINPGDSLFDLNGNKYLISQSLLDVYSDEDNIVHELNMESTDMYILSASGILVHNAPCFIAGTMIECEDLVKPIEDVKVGERVATYNHELNEIEFKIVEEVCICDNKPVIKVTIGDIEVTSTHDHPYYVDGKGYASYNPVQTFEDAGLEVAKLEVGDKVMDYNQTFVEVKSIEELEETETVYNLKHVRDNNNFYANNFLVHNRFGCFVAGSEVALANGDYKNIEDIVVGDLVLSWNEETHEIEANEVYEILQPVNSNLADLTFENSHNVKESNITYISCTYDHPIYVNTGDSFKISSLDPEKSTSTYDIPHKIDKLNIGDNAFNIHNGLSELKAIEPAEDKDPQVTYTLRVKNNNNFFVNGILVHNK
tara:strand:+ start:1179 stop:3494 length:2316 start_codon:yes stop_codon:yes gene_type:complete